MMRQSLGGARNKGAGGRVSAGWGDAAPFDTGDAKVNAAVQRWIGQASEACTPDT